MWIYSGVQSRLGITEAALAQSPAFQSHKLEADLFVGFSDFVLSYRIMSQVARRLEKRAAALDGTHTL